MAVVQPPLRGAVSSQNSYYSLSANGSGLQNVLCSRRRRTQPRLRIRVSASLSPWKTLGLPDDADEKQIKQAYRKLALKHHPDVVGEGESPELVGRFIEIQEAYEILVGKRRGKELDDHPFSGSWDFHDWYWKFSMSRRQSAKSPAAAASSAGAAPKQQVQSQLAGLRQKAAARASQHANSRQPAASQASQEDSLGVRSAKAWARGAGAAAFQEAKATTTVEAAQPVAMPVVASSPVTEAATPSTAAPKREEKKVEERAPREYASVVSFRPAQVEQPELAYAGAGASSRTSRRGPGRPWREASSGQARSRLQHLGGSGLAAMSPNDVLQCFRSVMGQLKARLEPAQVGHAASHRSSVVAGATAGQAPDAGNLHSEAGQAAGEPEGRPWWEEQVRGSEASGGTGRVGAGTEDRHALQFQLAGLRRKASLKRSMEGC